MKKISSFFSFC